MEKIPPGCAQVEYVDGGGIPNVKIVRVGGEVVELTKPDGKTVIASSRYRHPERKTPDVAPASSDGSSYGRPRRVRLIS